MTRDTSTRFIELNIFLGKIGMTTTGGKAKNIIRSGEIKVNGEIETRNKRKLHKEDIVEYQEQSHTVDEKLLR